jgi:hypothetical protein
MRGVETSEGRGVAHHTRDLQAHTAHRAAQEEGWRCKWLKGSSMWGGRAVTALRSPDSGLDKRNGSGMNGVLSRIGSIPRVASLDFWRDIVLKGTTSFSNLSAAVAGSNQPNPHSQPTAPAAEPSEQPKPNGKWCGMAACDSAV